MNITDKHKIVLIMTHRFGDIVQVFPALSFISSQKPDCKIQIVTYKEYTDAARLAPWVEKIHSVPMRVWDTDDSFSVLPDEFDELAKEADSTVVNLMASKESAFLARIAGGETACRLGRVYTPDITTDAVERRWEYLEKSGIAVHAIRPFPASGAPRFWRMMAGIPRARTWQPFHVSELFTIAVSEALKISPIFQYVRIHADPHSGSRLIQHLGNLQEVPRPWIGLQLGASNNLRTPPVSWLHTFVGKFLSMSKGSLILLGGNAELQISEELVENSGSQCKGRLINATAQARVSELPDLLSCLDTVISVDTFVLHLAAASGCPCVGLYPASASPVETGPYGPDHRILWVQAENGPCGCKDACSGANSSSEKCWDLLQPELVLQEALSILKLSGPGKAKSPCVRRLATSWTDQGQHLQPLDGRPLRNREESALSTVVKSWITGKAETVEPQPALAEGFRYLACQIGNRPFPDTVLSIQNDPTDWIRNQLRFSLDAYGEISPAVLNDTIDLCNYLSEILSGKKA